MGTQLIGGKSGLVTVKDLRDLENEEKVKEAARKVAEEPPILDLSAYVRRAFDEAHFERASAGPRSGAATSSSVTDRLLDCLRQRQGVYTPEIAQLIADQGGGSETYFNITEVKAKTAAAWIRDIIAQSGEKAWEIKPTPKPKLPAYKIQEATKRAAQQAMEFQERTGITPGPAKVAELALDLYDQLQQDLYDVAKETAERMETVMHDQCVEGGFYDAMNELIEHLVTYPIAILKGPIVRGKKMGVWNDETNEFDIETKYIPTWYAVNPNDFYPAPTSRDVQESYVCEVVNLDVRELNLLRGAEGWSTAGIEGVLADYEAGNLQLNEKDITGEWQRTELETRTDEQSQPIGKTVIRGVEFWGSIQGSHLLQMSDHDKTKLPKDLDPLRFYEACVITVGRYVIKAMLNPDPFGERPYATCAYEKVPGALWGKALPELMRDCQEPYNATLRNMIDHLAMGSGPMGMVDLDSIAPGQDWSNVAPRRWYQFHGADSASPKPIDFFQMTLNTSEYINVAEYFAAQADDRTQVPRFAHGNAEVGGAGSTASGLSMLMNAGSKAMKYLIAVLDQKVVAATLRRLYAWNMMFHEDPAIKGDAQVMPTGAVAALVREQTQLRRTELLALTNNPVDLASMGEEGRAELLRNVFAGADIPIEKLVQSNDEIKRRAEAAAAAQAGVVPSEEPPVEPGGGLA